jgi:tRNA-2-methylthio-N6-dimethylallyladenosine synthase
VLGSKKIHLKTYGCQMNTYDSLRIQNLLELYGCSTGFGMYEADVVILNTCHIREKATEKLYSELGRIGRNYEKLNKTKPIIVVAGCVSQAEGREIFSRSPFVDVIVGPQSYHTLPLLISEIESGKTQLINLDFIDYKKFDHLPEESMKQGASSFVSIQEGCDKFCTFCVVPYTRGKEFSRPLEQVYREVLGAVSLGSLEVVLLGQNVSAYHGKGSDEKEYDLADLISMIAQIPQLRRIRYTTSHPSDMTDKLLSLHQTEAKLMPLLHLPFQSGSDRILKLMNRKYTKDRYLEIINSLRKYRPDIAFSSDIIVGFPGETDEDFMQTLDLVDKVAFAQCYSFKYSPRPGTPSAVAQQVAESIKDERLQILQSKLQEHQLRFNQGFEGKSVQVLFEKEGKKANQMWGKSEYFQSVHVDAQECLEGKILDVTIKKAGINGLFGTVH